MATTQGASFTLGSIKGLENRSFQVWKHAQAIVMIKDNKNMFVRLPLRKGIFLLEVKDSNFVVENVFLKANDFTQQIERGIEILIKHAVDKDKKWAEIKTEVGMLNLKTNILVISKNCQI